MTTLSDRRAVLIRRRLKSSPRPLLIASDPALLAWLLAGALTAWLPYRRRWQICQVVARMTLGSRRARSAVAAITRSAGVEDCEARRAVRELYAGRLAAYFDVMRGLLLGADFKIACRGLAELQRALSAGRGAILWVSDFVGGADVMKVALSRAGHRVTHLSRIEHGFSKSRFGIRILNPIRIIFETAHLERRVVFDRMNPVPALIQLRKCLRANNVVSIMASAHEGTLLADVGFFAGRLTLSTGAVRLARVSGAPILPVFAIRNVERPDTFDVCIDPPLTLPACADRDEVVLAGARDYVARLERHVRIRPGAWGGWRRRDQLR